MLNKLKTYQLLKTPIYKLWLNKDVSLNELLFLKTLQANNVLEMKENYTSLRINHGAFGQNYVLPFVYKNLFDYNSFIYIGFLPRQEAAVLNIILARVKESNDSEHVNIGIGLDQFYSTNHLGSNSKLILSFLEGKHFNLSKIRLFSNSLIFYGLGFSSFLKNFEQTFIYLESKTYSKNTLMLSNAGLIHLLEVEGFSLYNNLLNKVEIKKHLNVNFSNKLKNNAESISFERHKQNISQNKLTVKLPITHVFEESQLLLNLSGKVQQNPKVVSKFNFKSQKLEDWIFAIKNIQEEVYFNFMKKFKENIIFYNTQRRLNPLNYKNTMVFSNSLLKNTFNMYNYYNVNINSDLNKISLNYYNFYLKKQKFFFGSSEFNIRNFFLNDSLSKNSSTMLKASLFNSVNKWNWNL